MEEDLDEKFKRALEERKSMKAEKSSDRFSFRVRGTYRPERRSGQSEYFRTREKSSKERLSSELNTKFGEETVNLGAEDLTKSKNIESSRAMVTSLISDFIQEETRKVVQEIFDIENYVSQISLSWFLLIDSRSCRARI